MKINLLLRRQGKQAIVLLITSIISGILGIYVGTHLQERQMQASAVGLMMAGAEAKKNGDYDHALLYLSQATGQMHDDPLILQSLAHVYEIKGNNKMALEFYNKAAEHYGTRTGGMSMHIEQKIDILKKEILAGEEK